MTDRKYSCDYKNPARVSSRTAFEASESANITTQHFDLPEALYRRSKTSGQMSFLEERLEELRDKQAEHGYLHPDVAETLNVLGLYHHHVTNDQPAALQFHQQALQVLEVLQEHPDHSINELSIGITLTDVGNVYKCLGKYDKAKRAYVDALSSFKLLGLNNDHPRVLSTKRCLKTINQHWKAQNVASLNQLYDS